jgi:hypothetical protein
MDPLLGSLLPALYNTKAPWWLGYLPIIIPDFTFHHNLLAVELLLCDIHSSCWAHVAKHGGGSRYLLTYLPTYLPTYLFSHATQLVPSSPAWFLGGGGKLRRMNKMLFNLLETKEGIPSLEESESGHTQKHTHTHTHTHTHIGLLLFWLRRKWCSLLQFTITISSHFHWYNIPKNPIFGFSGI